MKQTFENWTSYDDWLIINYNNFNMLSVQEVDGKIEIEYEEKK